MPQPGWPHDAIERCRLMEARLRILSETTRAFAEATTDPAHLLETVARRIGEVIKDSCVVLLVSDDRSTLTPVALFAADPEALRQLRDQYAEPFLLETHPISGRVHETGEPLFAPILDVDQFRPPRSTPRA